MPPFHAPQPSSDQPRASSHLPNMSLPLRQIADDVVHAAVSAVRMISEMRANTELTITMKDDGSPVTNVDLASHHFLVSALTSVVNIPVISEEDVPPFQTRETWKRFWLIDPLDNTAAFIEGDLSNARVLISLVDEGVPVLGVIASISTGHVICGIDGIGVLDSAGDSLIPRAPLPTPIAPARFTAYRSLLAEMSIETRSTLSAYGASDSTLVYSPTLAGRFLKLLEGSAEVMVEPRSLSSWDVAPFVACALAQGFHIYPLSNEALNFNAPSAAIAPFLLRR